jgi:hypothetical protein
MTEIMRLNHVFFIKLDEGHRNDMRGVHTHSGYPKGNFVDPAIVVEISRMKEIKRLSDDAFMLFACGNLDGLKRVKITYMYEHPRNSHQL